MDKFDEYKFFAQSTKTSSNPYRRKNASAFPGWKFSFLAYCWLSMLFTESAW